MDSKVLQIPAILVRDHPSNSLVSCSAFDQRLTHQRIRPESNNPCARRQQLHSSDLHNHSGLSTAKARPLNLHSIPAESTMSRVPEVVDLTSSTPHRSQIILSSPPQTSHASSSHVSQNAPRGIKRPRQGGHHNRHRSSSSEIFLGAEAIETIDMTDDSDTTGLAKAVAKQREDAIRAQQSPEHSDRERTALMAYKCPICMDTPVDATATSCGHLFCHKCIMDYLTITEETRADSSKQTKGTCPVCRKTLSRKDQAGKTRSLIPLQFKLHTKTRRELEAARKGEE